MPDTYAFTVPEADAVFVPDALKTRLSEMAKASSWTQADMDAEVRVHLAEMRHQHTVLTGELQAHAEIGGDKLAAAQTAAKRAIDFALPPGSAERARFDGDLATRALTNYPPLVLAFARIGRAMGEDGGGLTSATPPAGGEGKTDVATLFPSTPV